jgi:hypothetical protein
MPYAKVSERKIIFMRRMLQRLLRNMGFSRRIVPNFADVLVANQIDIVLDVGANDA